MNYPSFFNSKNSLILFGLQEEFNFLHKLYLNKRLPRVLMLTGNKGCGKSTLINHFFFSIFDSSSYDYNNYSLLKNSIFLKQYQNDIFSNVIYLKGSDFQSIKVDDVRNLKKIIYKSTIINKDRFIVLDDIELFNQNSLNALLKTIEEPTKNNFFLLINNKSRPLLNTIKSRSLEIKISLNEKQRLEIIENLIKLYAIEIFLDPKTSNLSPGNYIKFNHLCKEYDISLTNQFIENLSLLLNLYKKNKKSLFINFAFFLVDYYFNELNKKNIFKNNKIYEIKNYTIKNLNNFLLYNINQKALINAISSKIDHE